MATANSRWLRLEPHDELLSASVRRGRDSATPLPESVPVDKGYVWPPLATYWVLDDVGREYVVYVRGLSGPCTLSLTSTEPTAYSVHKFDPRTGDYHMTKIDEARGKLELRPPTAEDWVFVVTVPPRLRGGASASLRP